MAPMPKRCSAASPRLDPGQCGHELTERLIVQRLRRQLSGLVQKDRATFGQLKAP